MEVVLPAAAAVFTTVCVLVWRSWLQPFRRHAAPRGFADLLWAIPLGLLPTVTYWRGPAEQLGLLDPTEPVIAVVAAAALLALVRNLDRVPVGLLVTIGLFAVLAFGADTGNPKTAAIFLAVFIAAAAPAVLVRSVRQLGTVLTVLATTCAAYTLAGRLFPEDEGPRLALEGSNTIALGRAAGMAAVVTVAAVLSRRLRAAWTTPVLAVLVTAMVASARGPLAATLVGGAAMLVGARTRQLAARLGFLAVGAAAVAWAVATAPIEVQARISGVLASEGSVGVRLDAYGDAWSIIRSSPGGVGWGNFEAFTDLPGITYPHNIFLEIGAEAGWVAVAGFVSMLGWAFLRAWRVRDTAEGLALLGLLVYMTVNASVSGDVVSNWALFWTMGLALSPATRRSSDLEEADREPVVERRGEFSPDVGNPPEPVGVLRR